MIIGLLSDIHGRLDALEIAYDAASRQCDQVVCLGDIVNGGGDANACMNFVRERGIPTVRGNHDDSWLAMCGFTEMASPNFRYMRDLPVWIECHGLILVHDEPTMASSDPDAWRSSQGYLLRHEQAEAAFSSAGVFRNGPAMVAIGHTHIPALFTTTGQITLTPGQPASIPVGHSCILNPGAVGGRARLQWGNTYGIVDLKARTFAVHQLNLHKSPDPWDPFFDTLTDR